jgi:hypothetical protein
MSYIEDGFLAEPLPDIRAVVRKKYGDWRDLLDRANRLAVANQHSIVVHQNNNVERYAAVLFIRTLTTVQASVLLLEKGLLSQARTLLRSAMETQFSLTAIAKHPNFIDQLIDGHAAEQKRAAGNIRLWTHPELKRIAEAEISSGRWKSIQENSAKRLKTIDIAKKAGLEDWYWTVYMVFSWSAHGAALDLGRHVVKGADGEATGFRNEPDVEDQESSWLCAIEILWNAMNSLSLVFPNIDQQPLAQQYADILKLAEKWRGNPSVRVS